MPILRAMKATPTKALESELSIVYTNSPKTWKAATNESSKTSPEKLIYQQHYLKKVNSKKSTLLIHLGYQAKQVLTVTSEYQKISINATQIPSEISPSIEISYFPNLSVTILTTF